MKTAIGSYEAKTKLPELLRQVRKGKSFTITNRGEAIADLVPAGESGKKDAAKAIERFKEFMRDQPAIKVDIKALIEEGRD